MNAKAEKQPNKDLADRRDDRWIDAIGRDISAGWLAVAGVGRSVGEGVPGWAPRIFAWFKFVNRRKTDSRCGILPGWRISALGVLASCGAILPAILYADPAYLDWLRSSGGLAAGPRSIFETVTRFGQSDWILIATGIVIVVISLMTADRFRGGQKAVVQTVLLHGYYLFTTVAFAGLLANLLKNSLGRARPPFTPEGWVWFSEPFGHNYRFAAFPSGHATTAGAIAVALALLFPGFRAFFLIAGAWIAISRPALGVHFPSDVMAGFLFGGVFSYVYARSFARKRLLFKCSKGGAIRPRGEGRKARLHRRAGQTLRAAFSRRPAKE